MARGLPTLPLGEKLEIRATRNIHDINVSGNFADTAAIHNSGSRCVVTDTTVYAPGNRIAASQAIVDAAGPTQSSWRSRESSPSS